MDQPIRIILDTNLWISYLISNRLLPIDELLSKGSIVLLFSKESMEEFMEVVRRPKFEKYFGEDEISELLSLFEYYGRLVSVDSEVAVCRDPKDNFLLALAKDGGADYLITGDKDLLDIGTFEGASILTFNAFVDQEKR